MSVFTKSWAAVVVLTSAMPVAAVIAAQDKLQDIHALCAPHPYTPLSSEIPCTRALINASQDPIFNARDPATQLFVIGAGKLLRSLELKRISEDDAREKLLRMMLDTEDRHRLELESLQRQPAALQVLASATATTSTPPGSSTNGVDAKSEKIADRIEELQSDIEQHESAAQHWSDTAQNLAGSGCSGIGAALCQGIGQAGVAVAQANRDKELDAANTDRAEIRRLQRQSAR